MLEDRLTPSTYFVTNSADNLLAGSLRYAINQANSDPASTVEITSQVNGPIVLTMGELSITANMTLENDAGAAIEVHQSTPGARVFSISDSATDVTFQGSADSLLCITGGSVQGGNGAGILDCATNSQLTLIDVQITGNHAGQTGSPSDPTGGIGGGIYSLGSVTLQGCNVENNMADTGGGGVGINLGQLTVTDGSSVWLNSSWFGEGGGIAVAAGSVSVTNDSNVDYNSAVDVGGILVGTVNGPSSVAVSVTVGSTVSGNWSTAGPERAPSDLGGGGIVVAANGDVSIDASQVSNNQTVGMCSGGIAVGTGNVTVTDGSQIIGNQSDGPGGGIGAYFGGTVTVDGGSTVNGNSAAAIGGGIASFSGAGATVSISGSSQVNDNTVSNGQTIDQVLAVFTEVADGQTGFDRFAAAAGGAGGAAMASDLAATKQAAQSLLPSLGSAYDSLGEPAGVLVAGGGIGSLLAPISIEGGSAVDGNFCGTLANSCGPNVYVPPGSIVSLGGGVFTVSGQVTVQQSDVSGNQAPYGDGGGVWSAGTTGIVSAQFSDNVAGSNGGGFYNALQGQASIQNSTFQNNQATSGGGVASFGSLTVDTSTFANNSATNQGGGIGYSGPISLTGVDFVNNSPDQCTMFSDNLAGS